MKKLIPVLLIFSSFSFIWAEKTNNKILFLKGNITEKTTAVKNAEGQESEWLSKKAIKFCLENQEIIGVDRDLDALAVAAIVSLSSDNIKNYSSQDQHSLSVELCQLFSSLNATNTVQIAVLSKINQLKDILPSKYFTVLVNDYLANASLNTEDPSVVKAVINSALNFGNNQTFITLYAFWGNSKYKDFNEEIENVLIKLIPQSLDEIIAIMNGKQEQIIRLFPLILKCSELSTNNLCELAENVLKESITLIEDSSKLTDELSDIQSSALDLLSTNKWTRASKVSINYFTACKNAYNNQTVSEEQLNKAILALLNISPVEAVTPLTKYLEELNNKKEKGNKVSSEVCLAVIKTLGAIGDKAAFDSLLAVTYLNYPEKILSAAREALAGLRW